MKRILLTVGFLLVFSGVSHAEDLYVGQSSAGGDTGADCANQHSATWFNTSGNWGAGAGKVSPGDTVHLCGTFTPASGGTSLTWQGSGTAGNPITVVFETGAKILSTYCNVYGNSSGCLVMSTPGSPKNYLILDGGTACGWDTATLASEGACNGKIYSTTNGTGLSTKQTTNGIEAENCTNCEIKNLGIEDQYVNSGGDTTANVQATSCIYFSGSNFHIHNNNFTNSGWCLFNSYTSGEFGVEINNNTMTHLAHGYIYSQGGNVTATGPWFHDNGMSGFDNWDTAMCDYHLTGIHAYGVNVGGSWPNPGDFYIYNNYLDVDPTCATGPIFLEGNPASGSNTPWTLTGRAILFNNITKGLATSSNAGGTSNNLIFNNTFLGTLTNSFALGGTFKNNIYSGVGAGAGSLFNDNSTPSGTGDYNGYFNCSGFNCFNAWAVPATGTWANYQANTYGQEQHSFENIAGSPPIDASYVPNMGSSLVSSGTNMSAVCATFPTSVASACQKDLYGTARPGGSTAWDVGAAMYGGAVGPWTITVNTTNPSSGVAITATADANGKTAGNSPTSFVYADGSNITVTAAATVGSWTGNCTPSMNTCSDASVNASANYTANYTVTPPVILTIHSTNPASGVTIVCTNDTDTTSFTHSYSVGDAVTCTAPSTVGLNTFQSWSCPGGTAAGNVCSFSAIATDTTITANYGGGAGPGCQQSNSSFSNASIVSQSGTFTVTFTDQPSQNNMDGVLGFSMGAATAYSNLAVIVRFSEAGIIDAWNQAAGNYAHVNSFSYNAGVIYSFRLVVDSGAGTYDAYVTAPGGSATQIASGYTFRTGAEPLDNWAVTSEVGYHIGCGVSIGSPVTHTLRSPVIISGTGQ